MDWRGRGWQEFGRPWFTVLNLFNLKLAKMNGRWDLSSRRLLLSPGSVHRGLTLHLHTLITAMGAGWGAQQSETYGETMTNLRFAGIVALVFLMSYSFFFKSDNHRHAAVVAPVVNTDDDDYQYWTCRVDGTRCNRTLEWLTKEEVRRARDITQ